MESLFDRIESLCKSRGYTITSMCRESGAPRGSLTDLKKGRTSRLSSDTLQTIADFFGITVDELLGREVNGIDAELAEYLEMLRTRPECRMLLQTIKGSTKEEVEANVRVIEALRGVNH